RHDWNGHAYRVTVERAGEPSVDTESAEPIGWANRYKCGWASVYPTEQQCRESVFSQAMETAVPLYRHPAPASDSLTVAPENVVEKLRQSIKYLRSATVGSDGCENVCDKANATL